MQALKIWEYDDIFNPVTDLNDNFEKVKGAIDTLETGAGTDEQDIRDLKTKVGTDNLVTTAQDLSGAINELDDDINHAGTGINARLTSAENDINTLQTQAGNATLVTTAQTLSGAVNELDDDLNHANTGLIARVTDLETQAGNATLATTAQTLSGAVNELDDDLNHANTGLIARVTDLETQAGNETLITIAQTLSGAINELTGRVSVKQIQASADTYETALETLITYFNQMTVRQKRHAQIRIGYLIFNSCEISDTHFQSAQIHGDGSTSFYVLNFYHNGMKLIRNHFKIDNTLEYIDMTQNTQNEIVELFVNGLGTNVQ